MVLVYCLVPQDVAAVVQDCTLPQFAAARLYRWSHIAARKKDLSNAACLHFWWSCQQINMLCDSQILGWKFAKLQTHSVQTVCHC